MKYMQAFYPVALKLLQAFALALDYPEDFFDEVSQLVVVGGQGELLGGRESESKIETECKHVHVCVS